MKLTLCECIMLVHCDHESWVCGRVVDFSRDQWWNDISFNQSYAYQLSLRPPRRVLISFPYIVRFPPCRSILVACSIAKVYIFQKLIEISTGSAIIKNYCHYLRSMWFTPPGTLNTSIIFFGPKGLDKSKLRKSPSKWIQNVTIQDVKIKSWKGPLSFPIWILIWLTCVAFRTHGPSQSIRYLII